MSAGFVSQQTEILVSIYYYLNYIFNIYKILFLYVAHAIKVLKYKLKKKLAKVKKHIWKFL